MKKILFTLCLWLTVSWLYAQKQSDPKLFTGNAVLQEHELGNGSQIYLQVGSPIHYNYEEVPNVTSFNIRFPWDVAYIPLTFSEDLFEVSKGYYSDKVKLDWEIQSNSNRIDQIRIYRREYLNNSENEFVLLATLSNDSYTYEDSDTQGGVLYEYKVEATGVSSMPQLYVTYITGVGYRNPTGVVAGNVSFDGGSPVKDVVVRADPQGGDLNFGSSLLFTNASQLSIPLRGKELNETITLQAWVKVAEGSSANLFELHNQQANKSIYVSYKKTDGSFALTVDDAMTFTVSDFYPNGNLDGQGNDLFNPINDADQSQTNFSENFVHVTLVLVAGDTARFYLNGRNINKKYVSSLPKEATIKPTITISGNYVFNGFETTEVVVAKSLTGNIDEVRLWDKALEEKQIRTDFKRYLGGSEPSLISYIRCDEKVGEYAYDISKIGVEFNKNHARIINGTWVDDKPTSSQLGILGVTDSLGNYIISAIPFSGSGESYTITPMFGVHQFEPGQQLVFVGNGSEVINKVNFLDISSFDFLGKVYYTTNGIFAPADTLENATFLGEAGYNQYDVIMDGNQQKVSKGTHFYDVSDPSNPKLYETPTIFVEGANVFIDGDIVLDKNKRPVVTGDDGSFKIKVPIGEHYIEVRKDKHTFTHGGRFPAAREDGNDLFEFFEHQQTPVTFLDTTRVSLVGRVVGGVVEAEKPIGFGYNGSLKEIYNAGTDEEETVDISSINNIGQATITLGYSPPKSGVQVTTTFTTNSETGEYKVDLIPINYTIDQTKGIRIASNPGTKLLKANETVNLSDVPDTTFSEYVDPMDSVVTSAPYHFVKSFTYRSVPVLNVVDQSSDLEVWVSKDDGNGNIQEVAISTEGFEQPVYTQGVPYAIIFETFEEYLNKDAGAGMEVSYRVPIVDGEFNITNNLALPGSESLTVDEENPNISKYIFRGGMPSISPPFTRNIDIRYRVDGKDYDATNYEKSGIILGGQSDGSQTFVTKAPNMPDIILRDPPGSNSFASIEKGQSISFTEEGSFSVGQSAGASINVSLGVKFAAGGGVTGPIVESEAVNNLSTGLSLEVESTTGKSITKTYTFNQTISTSDDPDFVGSEGDLYIGNTKNYYHGSYDNIEARNAAPSDRPFFELKNSEDESVYIYKKSAFYFSEEPTETFFIFSQKYVLETLIPELTAIVEGIESGDIVEDTPGVLKKSYYEEQIRAWQKIIQENERTKYATLYDRENYKNRIKESLEKEIEDLNDHLIAISTLGATNPLIGAQSIAEAISIIEEKKGNLEQKIALLENEFINNISFDAGVGEYTKSSAMTIAQQNSRILNLNLDASLNTTFGFNVSGSGVMVHTDNNANTSINSALTEDSEGSTIVAYTLKDGDPGNFLSVDVVNTFDGNGPIFSTVGGRTSCPYEGIDTTLFYNNDEFKSEPIVMGPFGPEDSGTIYSGGDQISYATQRLEVPVLSVETASVTDVPEERPAEFTLLLENNNVAEADANFLLYVDNTTNPYNAIINIDQNGTVVHVPYGETVEYALTLKKSISDVYEYKDIKVVLASLCDGKLINDTVRVSAIFRPSCTAVQIDSPLENWVFNAGDAYNADNTTNPMNIAMFGYNRLFSSFENFRLEYRKSTSSTWTRLQTYYNTQELLDEAIVAGEDQGTLITENTTNFSWDIGALGLADGQYELRVVSNCSNGTEFVSDVIKGTVDLNVPVQFGTPTPTDGILGAGEDLRLQFSEPIFYSSALSKIEIKGETNQQEISHNVTVHFEGADNTMVIEKPNIVDGDFSIEFWMLTSSSGVIFEQANGLKLAVNNGVLEWTHGGKTLSKAIANDGAFHHYTLTYSETNDRLSIYQDDQDLGSLENAGIGIVENNNSLVIGGNTFVGNLHDLRFWSKPLTLSEAYAAQFNELMGTERDLVGYWPMNEGTGAYANDLARFKHAQLNAEWDIKPKGTAYEFKNDQYLVLDDVDFVQITDLMDVTLSFWMKTDNQQKATLFSNGLGNGEDLIQSNGKANKWAVSIENGILYLNSEGKQYKLSNTNLADNSWHHVAIVLRRIGTLKTYIDAAQESSNPMTEIGGLSGNKFWVGARGFTSTSNVDMVDEMFTGKIDELRLWNMARSTEQITRDRFNEVDFNSIGLMLYARMNQPDPITGSGPSYYHKAVNETVLPSNAKLSAGQVSYTQDAPKITLERQYLSFEVSHVINGDEIILTPLVSDWSVLEGQIIDITIDRMFDVYGNKQSSPVTWSAYVRRNEVTWFVADGSQKLSIEKKADQPYNFEITLINKGGKQQPYSIENIPQWMSADNSSGTLDPNSSKVLNFQIDPELTIGEYSLDLFLNTDFNFDEKILIELRVLEEGPDWEIDPENFEYNMNIIGKIKINGVFIQDKYSKVAAFVGSELRGFANLAYDENFDEYFLYLNVFSNEPTGEAISFKIWDANTGKIFQSLIDGEPTLPFIKNEVVGYKSVPVIFESTGFIEQSIALNSGWTWMSIYVEDPKLDDLNELTSTLSLEDDDLIKNQNTFDIYDDVSGWNGSLSNSGGITTKEMFKVKLANNNNLTLTGKEVDIATWGINVAKGWNWLSYPLSNNISINEALSLLEAEEGDVIKNQTAFAIYDPNVGWSGTLNYMEAGEGYMLKSSKDQAFNYPVVLKSKSGKTNGKILAEEIIPMTKISGWNYYEHNMNVVAEIISEEAYDTVWVVDSEGTVRGKSSVISFEGRLLSYITVFGNEESSKELMFQISKGASKKPTSVNFNFSPDVVLGTINDPVILGEEIAKSNVYPNPFTDHLNIGINADETGKAEITIANLTGNQVYKSEIELRSGYNRISVSPAIPAGVYFLTVIVDGQKKFWKIIKN